ncbi:MAG TPA: hypothetical protein VK789_13095 [Bryobacteraceae bacterium]|jgi:hypothetical protein|nr:hypothetical protein [Bryobacteraceae bacterium]
MIRFASSATGVVLTITCGAFAQLPPSIVLSPEDMNGARGEIARLEALAGTAPDRCAVVSEIARTWAIAGQYPEAIAALQKVAALNAGFDIARDSVFVKVRGTREFETIVQSARDATPPIVTSRLAFKVAEGDLVPENLAYDPARREFYFGSQRKHKIIRCRSTGVCQPFAEGLGTLLGLKVETRNRTLWALSNSDSESGLFHYDLASAKLMGKYVLAGAHLFNDVAIAAEGDIYLTDTRTGSVYWLRHGKDTLEVFGPSGRFRAANGIAISPDQRTLYLSSFGDGITLIDLTSGAARPIARPPDLCLGYIDGLYALQRSLIAIQNGPMTPRVVRLRLNREGDRIERFEVLERRNPMFDGVTTGVIAGNQFYFMANIQDEKTEGAVFDPISILRIALNRDSK